MNEPRALEESLGGAEGISAPIHRVGVRREQQQQRQQRPHRATDARGCAAHHSRTLSLHSLGCTSSAPDHIRGRGGRTAPRVREEASAARYCATAGGRGRGHGRNLRFRAISPRDAARRENTIQYTDTLRDRYAAAACASDDPKVMPRYTHTLISS